MDFFRQFDQFDPKTGRTPYYPFSSLQDIAWRAQSILQSRTREEIIEAAKIIDGIIDSYFEEEKMDFIQEQLENDGWACKYLGEQELDFEGMLNLIHKGLPEDADPDEYFDFTSEENTSELDALKTCIDEYDIDGENFKHAKQYEYFAVLALWLIGECINWLQYNKEEYGTRQSVSNISLAGDAAIQAMDAICHAEHLMDKAKNIDKAVAAKVAQFRSESARKAAAIRHEEHAMLRQETIEYYELHKNSYRSIEDAARNIAGKIVPVTHRTVVGWISKHKKTQSARKL